MKTLIINADDFGLHETVNRAIIESHRIGCVTSASIMAGGQAFDQAVQLAAQHPALGIGVHLTLVGGEYPVCRPEEIPSLVEEDGRLARHYPTFLLRCLQGKINLQEVERELTAQVQKAAEHGISITHLDSHQHMHIVPGIIGIAQKLACRFGIKALRIPDEAYGFMGGVPFQPARFIARGGLTFLARLARRSTAQCSLKTPGHFFGMLTGGNMQEDFLQQIISALPEGTSEIMVHPGTDNAAITALYGWDLHGQEEFSALTSPAILAQLKAQQVKLISFRDL